VPVVRVTCGVRASESLKRLPQRHPQLSSFPGRIPRGGKGSAEGPVETGTGERLEPPGGLPGGNGWQKKARDSPAKSIRTTGRLHARGAKRCPVLGQNCGTMSRTTPAPRRPPSGLDFGTGSRDAEGPDFRAFCGCPECYPF